jgi:hypothetical protein
LDNSLEFNASLLWEVPLKIHYRGREQLPLTEGVSHPFRHHIPTDARFQRKHQTFLLKVFKIHFQEKTIKETN